MAAVATMTAKDPRATEPATQVALLPVAAPEAALTGGMAAIEQHPEWNLLSRLPMRLTATIPLPGFKVKDLLHLAQGSMVRSEWLSTDDVPLKIGAVQLSWSEFEVVEQRMAIRLTRLA
jgi:hypothetical protein